VEEGGMLDPSSVVSATSGLFTGLGEVLAKRLGAAWSRVRWKFAEDEYRSRVIQDLSRTRLFGAHDLLDLGELFTDVYFLPEASATRLFRAQQVSEVTSFEQLTALRERERIPAEEVLKDSERLYILGTPGSGKSTFLRHMAILTARKDSSRIPIFVSLKLWSESGKSFLDYAAHELDVCGFPDSGSVLVALLEGGGALLLLDGLDEVQTLNDTRDKLLTQIIEVSRRYRKARLFLTCRTSSNDHSFNDFKYVEVADFTDKQQDQFVAKWFARDRSKLQGIAAELSDPDSKRLRDLAKKPLFLALLCIVFDQLQEFPRSRSELYHEAIEVLLSKWDSSRSIRRETYALQGPTRKRQLLSHLAMRTFEEEKFVFPGLMVEAAVNAFLRRTLGASAIEEVDVARLLRSIESAHGIIVERGKDYFSFSHLSIHEYLTAEGVVNRITAGRPWSEVLPVKRISDSRWRDVVVHSASILSEADSLLSHLQTCLKQYLAQQQLVKMFVGRIGAAIKLPGQLHLLHGTPDEFFARHFGGSKDGPVPVFAASPHLRASIRRLVDLLVVVIQRERGQQSRHRVTPSMEAWRRAVALREVVSLPKGVPAAIGDAKNWEAFDHALRTYFYMEELRLTVFAECMVGNRDAFGDPLLMPS
jgi:predicted NACHT family NTPase